MTNFEKYKEEILRIMDATSYVSVKDGKLTKCNSIKCEDCELNSVSYNCRKAFFKWLYEEYQEPEVDWNNVAVDTPILVSNDGESWRKRYFAEFRGGTVYAFQNGATSWSNEEKFKACWKYAKLAEVEHERD